MKLVEYDFDLPERLIARFPNEKRDESRLLIVDRNKNTFEESQFKNLIKILQKDDCLVLNDTKVFPARLYGTSVPTGRKHEFLLINSLGNRQWKVLIKKSKNLNEKDQFLFHNELKGKITKKLSEGISYITFNKILTDVILDEIGEMALPPYIVKLRRHIENDKITYQTVYSNASQFNNESINGSIAAPTAGLHFTKMLLNQLKKKVLY